MNTCSASEYTISELHSFCVTGMSSGLATRMTFTQVSQKKVGRVLHGGGGILLLISFLDHIMLLLVGCILNDIPCMSVTKQNKPLYKIYKCCLVQVWTNYIYISCQSFRQLTWEKPDKVFFCAPSTITLQAGILDSLVNPPATPIIFAAVDAPTMIDRLGAMKAILLST